MQNVLLLTALVVAAYVVSHSVVERLRTRFLISAGVEYILVGLMLGPAMPWTPLLSEQTLESISPIITLAIGWIGLLYGMRANVRETLEHLDGPVPLALNEWFTTLLVVAGGAWLLDRTLLPIATAQGPGFLPWMLAASAAVGSGTTIHVVQKAYGAEGRLTKLLVRASRLGELFAILAFGGLVCAYHDPVEGLPGWNYANWLVLSLGLGLGLGVMFRLFIGGEHNADKQFMALLGIVVFASGAAYYMELSPLLVNLVLGLVLGGLADNDEEIMAVLERYHRPMVIMLLVFAGALLRWPGWSGLLLAVAFVLLRGIGKLVGGSFGSVSMQGRWRRDVGRGLLGHGEVAVAMAISMRLLFEDEAANVGFTVILFSVFANEIWSARLLRGLLIDCGDIAPEQARMAEAVIPGADGEA